MKAKKVFKSKKITKAEEKKLAPLTSYWSKRILKAKFSNDGRVRMEGFVIGFVVCLIASFIVIGLWTK